MNMDRIPAPIPATKLSICACGHTGDAAESFHAPRFAAGHGACVAPGCNCRQFTWTRRASDEERTANAKAMCFYVIATERKGDGYMVALVRRDVAGYAPTGEYVTASLALAEETIADRNAARGLSPRDCFEIVSSSMR
jgi:hypothetical protein